MRVMNKQQKIFLPLTITLGLVVIGSYILGINSSGTADIMWGGVPNSWRGIYTLSMIISALSFFVFSLYTFTQILSLKAKSRYPLNTLHILYFLILLPSALWIPLVNFMISNPTDLTWIAIRVVLILVALGSLGLLLFFLTLSSKTKVVFYYLSVVGLIIFLFHTAILDAIVWPLLWKYN
jgi:hypothetical protein